MTKAVVSHCSMFGYHPIQQFSGLCSNIWLVREESWAQQMPPGKISFSSRNSKVLMMSLTGRIRNKKNPYKYSSVITTDNILDESRGVSFDQYLEDTPRVLNALFREERSQKLDQDIWRIEMLPVKLLFLSVIPVVEMQVRCKPSGEVCLPQLPPDTAYILDFSIMKWEFRGLNLKPSQFSFSVRGVIYPDRRQMQARLKGHLDINIGYSLPPTLSFIPEDLLKNAFEEGIRNLVVYMNRNLLCDYNNYRRDLLRN